MLFLGEIHPCICVSTSTHVNVMSCHMCTQTTWRSELGFYKKFQLCEKEAGISMKSVLWFSQQYHYNSLFTGHVLTSLNSYILVTSPKLCHQLTPIRYYGERPGTGIHLFIHTTELTQCLAAWAYVRHVVVPVPV